MAALLRERFRVTCPSGTKCSDTHLYVTSSLAENFTVVRACVYLHKLDATRCNPSRPIPFPNLMPPTSHYHPSRTRLFTSTLATPTRSHIFIAISQQHLCHSSAATCILAMSSPTILALSSRKASTPSKTNKAPAPAGLGQGVKRCETFGSGTTWMNMWLGSSILDADQLISCNTGWPPSLDELTELHIEEDHLHVFLSQYGMWMARNKLPKIKQPGFLTADSKYTYFKACKGIMFQMFSNHPLLKLNNDKWWIELLANFLRESKRTDQLDHEVIMGEKSAPLYRNIISSSLTNDDLTMLESPEGRIRAQSRGQSMCSY